MKIKNIFLQNIIIILLLSACSSNQPILETPHHFAEGKWGGEVQFDVQFFPFENVRIGCTALNGKRWLNAMGQLQKATFWVVGNKAYGYLTLAGKIIEIEAPLDSKGGFEFKEESIYIVVLTELGTTDFYLDISGKIILNNEEKSSFGKITISEFSENYSCTGIWRLYKHWK